MSQIHTVKKVAPCEKCPNTKLFLIHIFQYSVQIQENTDQKQLCIWTFFTQCRLFISRGEEITSAEGTRQGDPSAMPIYTLGSLPLLNMTTTENTKYAAYADDISCVEILRNILTWWSKLNTFFPKIGYFPKADKSWLIVKPGKYEAAKSIFKDTSFNITNDGKRHIGAVVGTE